MLTGLEPLMALRDSSLGMAMNVIEDLEVVEVHHQLAIVRDDYWRALLQYH
jgi:hypothetical protein